MAQAWVDHGRFPSEIRALPLSERAFLTATYEVAREDQEAAKKNPGS